MMSWRPSAEEHTSAIYIGAREPGIACAAWAFKTRATFEEVG